MHPSARPQCLFYYEPKRLQADAICHDAHQNHAVCEWARDVVHDTTVCELVREILTLKGVGTFHGLGEDIDVLMKGIDVHHGCAQAAQESEGLVVHVNWYIGLLQCLA